MKILYAIQGTGNGHLSRANDIVPVLKKNAEVELLLSGIQADVSIPFEIKYNLKGMSFIFGKKGGVDIKDTIRKTGAIRLWNEIRSLPVNDYDLIINDFEPISAWAARLRNIPCISLSHQAAVLNANAPKPEKPDLIGKLILNNYAPSDYQYGFHFESYDENIYTPVIRKQARKQNVSNNGHYTVYLPAYSDERIIKTLSYFKEVKWEVFSKHSKTAYREHNVFISPINNDDFIKSMAFCEGVFCGAGFETPAEALFMGKKLMVIPMKSQYEQQCNAAALAKMGVPVIYSIEAGSYTKIGEWLQEEQDITVNYPDNTESIIEKVLEDFLFRHEDVRLSNALA